MTAPLRHPLALAAQALLPAGCAVAGGPIALWDGPIFPEEAAAVARAVPKRRAEFAAGRRAARAALAALGLPPLALPRRADGPALWPEGFAGSIAHGGGHVLAAACPLGVAAALGLDLEPLAPLDDGLRPAIAEPDEDGDLLRLFCAKEAAYKAQFALSARLFGFHGLRVTLTGDGFEARFAEPAPPFGMGDRIAGRQTGSGNLLVTAVALSARNAAFPPAPLARAPARA
jgi:4'-phosphopantetheinyl transferase EntD